jgi:hypothetical protein
MNSSNVRLLGFNHRSLGVLNNEIAGPQCVKVKFAKLKYVFIVNNAYSRDSVVGIAASYGLDDRGVGVRVPVGSRIFSSPDSPDRL